MDWFKNLDDDVKRKICIGIILSSLLIIVCVVFGFKHLQQRALAQTVTIEKVTGDYTLVASTGPEPLIISVKEKSTGKLYENSRVSEVCPLYANNAEVGKELTLTRYTNIGIETNKTSYFFKGAYEQLCTRLKYNPQSGDTYFKG